MINIITILRSLFLSDIARKIVALFLAIALYWGIRLQNNEIKTINDVPVKLNLHDELVDTSNKEYKISVEVEGQKEVINNLSAKDLEVQVDVSDRNLRKDSSYYVELNAKQLYRYFNSGFKQKVTKIKDKGLVLFLQKNITTTKKIDVKYKGSLKEGLTIEHVTVYPAEVQITGPKNIVDSIIDIKTEPVPLTSDITDYFEYEVNLVPIKDIKINHSKVSINGSLANKLEEKRFNNCKLSILNFADNNLEAKEIKQSVSIIVEGPPKELNELDSKDIVTYLDVSSCQEAGTYNIEVMANVKEPNKFPNVKVIRKLPSKVDVEISKATQKVK